MKNNIWIVVKWIQNTKFKTEAINEETNAAKLLYSAERKSYAILVAVYCIMLKIMASYRKPLIREKRVREAEMQKKFAHSKKCMEYLR